jgi:hypothetical protein
MHNHLVMQAANKFEKTWMNRRTPWHVMEIGWAGYQEPDRTAHPLRQFTSATATAHSPKAASLHFLHRTNQTCLLTTGQPFHQLCWVVKCQLWHHLSHKWWSLSWWSEIWIDCWSIIERLKSLHRGDQLCCLFSIDSDWRTKEPKWGKVRWNEVENVKETLKWARKKQSTSEQIQQVSLELSVSLVIEEAVSARPGRWRSLLRQWTSPTEICLQWSSLSGQSKSLYSLSWENSHQPKIPSIFIDFLSQINTNLTKCLMNDQPFIQN